MKLNRVFINGLLAAAFVLSAVAVESGALNSLATVAFADTIIPASVSPVTRSNSKGSTGTLSGTYTWTTDASFTITVTRVDTSSGKGTGKITQVLVSASNGQHQTYGSTGKTALTSFPVLGTGLTMTFGSSSFNKTNGDDGDTYKFSATAPKRCGDDDRPKSRCRDD